jgi:hypothetical protein
MGGVFNVVNLHVYHYAGNNPVVLVDPTGRLDEDPNTKTIYANLDDYDDLNRAMLALSGRRTSTEIGYALSAGSDYKVVATGENGTITFYDVSSMSAYLEMVDPSGSGFIIVLGGGFSVGGATAINAGGGIMIGFSSKGIKIYGYGETSVTAVIANASAGGKAGVIIGTGDPSELNGISPTLGFSIGNGPSAGADITMDKKTFGVTFSVGIAARGLPIDIHIGGSGIRTRKIWESR